MAFTYGFYNSVNHDRKYDAVQMGQIFDGIITDGIYATYLKAMVVKASSNASEVIVQPGRAWFNHTWSYNDADYPVAAPEPEVVLDRIDTLVLDINAEDASRTNSYLWVQGTPTSQVPEPPTLIHTATHNQYPLCDVYRQAGTTQIYAADITNRVGTSDCPFVTGVLEGINIDDLLAQWDDEFHTWENATKASFEGWMVNQQAVYTAWWDALKAQMAGDVADVEAWIETIHDILDEEVATRLQAEIDEIKTELPSGSHITVTTSDTELYSRTVTITDEANHTVTSQFDATGVAVFKTVPYVGNLTISSTDGTRTATSVVQTPYFARYQFAIAFWSATVNIDGTSELGGETVSITDSSLALVGTVVLNASGLGVFNATYPDTYKFSVTHGGETMSVTLEVSQETTYNVEIHGGFNWQRWVDLSENYSSSDFDDLDELLADQKAVRELMTIHDCVDYLADATRADANITKIINNNICAKWINNRDYALDALYANSAIAAVMDTADKYFYGEWALMPQVPKMTSNITPYGEASLGANAASGADAYKAFDGNDSTNATYASASTTAYITYQFVEATDVRAFMYRVNDLSSDLTLQISYSDNGVSYTNAGNTFTYGASDSNKNKIYTLINSYGKHIYWRLTRTRSSAGTVVATTLQFYAYAPKGCVPKMTGNTAPYGECIASSSTSTQPAYYAFDKSADTYWMPNSTVPVHCGYHFTNPACVKKVAITHHNLQQISTREITHGKIQASNDGTNWVDIVSDFAAPSATLGLTYYVDCSNNDEYYSYYRVYVTAVGSGDNNRPYIAELQFYGRQLSVSVPVMTSNTAPYGTVIYSSQYNSDTRAAWHVFNRDTSLQWAYASNDTSPRVGYGFASPTVINCIDITFGANVIVGGTQRLTGYKVLASNSNSDWDNATELLSVIITSSEAVNNLHQIKTFENNTPYLYYTVTIQTASTDGTNVVDIQFYGLDYSEKEFEAGTTKKWLYDHGVELESIYTVKSGSSVITKEENAIYFKTVAGQMAAMSNDAAIDLTEYDLVRAKIDPMFSNYAGLLAAQLFIKPAKATGTSDYSSGYIAVLNAYPSNKDTFGLDVSSINQNEFLSFGFYGGDTYVENRINELWLE